MELAIIIGVLLFFFTRGGQFGLVTGSGTQFSAGVSRGTQAQQFALAQAAGGTAAIEGGIGIATQAASTIAVDAGVSATSAFATAIPVVGSAVAAVAGLLLAQHTARLKGAVAENQLIPGAVQAYDADLQQLVAAINSGQATPAQGASATYQMWNSIHNYMRQNASGPGRAWVELGDIGTIQAVPCNKACTAECCVFWNDIHPTLANLYAFLSTGKPIAYGGVGTPYFTGFPDTNKGRTLATGVTINVAQVAPPTGQYASAYGNYSRAAYSLTLQRA